MQAYSTSRPRHKVSLTHAVSVLKVLEKETKNTANNATETGINITYWLIRLGSTLVTSVGSDL